MATSADRFSTATLLTVMMLGLSNPVTGQGLSFRGLGDLSGGSCESRAFDVSDDGRVVVGVSVSARGEEAFRWTAKGGMVGLGDLPDGRFRSLAHAVSVVPKTV